MSVFVEGELQYPEKNPMNNARTNNKLDPHVAPGRNLTQVTLVGQELSPLRHHQEVENNIHLINT